MFLMFVLLFGVFFCFDVYLDLCNCFFPQMLALKKYNIKGFLKGLFQKGFYSNWGEGCVCGLQGLRKEKDKSSSCDMWLSNSL